MKKVSFLFAFCVLFFLVGSTYAVAGQEDYKYLDDLALKAGADKGSNFHNYTEVYAQYFSSLKDKPIKFLEIGIDRANSVKLWEAYFPNADLHFMDITFQNVQYFSTRSKYHLANQESAEDLARFIQEAGGAFDIILDDGGHTMNQQITSFRHLFPHVKSGGMYIIEDLHTSYWKSFGGGKHRHTTVAFLKSLIDDVNFVGAQTSRASHLNIDPAAINGMNIYREQILSIHFYDSVAIIIKR